MNVSDMFQSRGLNGLANQFPHIYPGKRHTSLGLASSSSTHSLAVPKSDYRDRKGSLSSKPDQASQSSTQNSPPSPPSSETSESRQSQPPVFQAGGARKSTTSSSSSEQGATL